MNSSSLFLVYLHPLWGDNEAEIGDSVPVEGTLLGLNIEIVLLQFRGIWAPPRTSIFALRNSVESLFLELTRPYVDDIVIPYVPI